MFQKNPYMKSKTISKPMLLVNIILLILLTTTYLIVCTFSCAVMILIRLILSFNKRWQLKFSLFLKSLWLNLTVTVLGFYFVHPLNICYDKQILQKKKCVVISNHLTNYDWIYVLVVLAKLRMYEDLVIILKESLSKLPVYGYGMKVFGYIFLKRDWNKDREILAKGLVKTRDRNRYFMLLFPEGTLIDPETHAKSKKFIEQNPIKLDDVEFNPENVILPRKTGFQMIYENLKDQIDGIIDITLLVNPYQQYPSEEFSLYDVFVKRSKKLDFRFVVDFVDKTEINDEQWIYRVFKKKEEMIDKYKKIDTKKVEFKDVMDKLVEQKGDKYVFDTTAIWSRWSNLQILGSLMGYALCLYFIFR